MGNGLKYLSFKHITGFDGLNEAYKDSFIELYKRYVNM